MQQQEPPSIYVQSQVGKQTCSIYRNQSLVQQQASTPVDRIAAMTDWTTSTASCPTHQGSSFATEESGVSVSSLSEVSDLDSTSSSITGQSVLGTSSRPWADVLLHKHLLASTSHGQRQSWATGASQPVVVPSDRQLQQTCLSYHTTPIQLGYRSTADTSRESAAAGQSDSCGDDSVSVRNSVTVTSVVDCTYHAPGENSSKRSSFCLDGTDGGRDSSEVTQEGSGVGGVAISDIQASTEQIINQSSQHRSDVRLWRSFSDDSMTESQPQAGATSLDVLQRNTYPYQSKGAYAGFFMELFLFEFG